MTHDQIREHLLRNLNLDPVGDKPESLEQILSHPRLLEGNKKADERLGFGHFRYGSMYDPHNAGYDQIGSAIDRLVRFIKGDRNQEYILDAWNLLRVAYVFAPVKWPDSYFESVDDGIHTEREK